MSVEIEGTESSEKPNIINSTVLIDEKEVVIPTLNGRAYREKVVAQLGKRFVCKQTIETTSTREETDPQTGKTRVVTSKTVNYFGGLMEDVNGNGVYLGCGTEVLTIKPSSEAKLLCCGIAMSLLQPQTLPTAD